MQTRGDSRSPNPDPMAGKDPAPYPCHSVTAGNAANCTHSKLYVYLLTDYK